MRAGHEQESPLRFFEAQTPENIRLARRRQQIRLNEPLPFPRSTFGSSTSSGYANESRHSPPLGNRRLVSYGRATIGKHGDEGPPLNPPARYGAAGLGLRSRLSFGGLSPKDAATINMIPSRGSLQSEAMIAPGISTNTHRRTYSSNIEPAQRSRVILPSPPRPTSAVDDVRPPGTTALNSTRLDGGGRAKLDAVEAQYLANTFESELKKRLRRFRALQSPKAESFDLIYNAKLRNKDLCTNAPQLVFRVSSTRDQTLDTDLCLDPKNLIGILDDLLIRCETGLQQRRNN